MSNTHGPRRTTNRLAREKSPYLRQHESNPVDWYPWGAEAFEKARRDDKPVFLSIGYSTCHWCHVMEHESFADEQVARLLNDGFVAIKVDREERPDLDGLYMRVCQMMTGSGGWPLTLLLTPDQRPFFAGTYIPKDDRHGRLGLVRLLPAVAEAWRARRPELLASADRVLEHLRAGHGVVGAPATLTEGVLDEAFDRLSQMFDERDGGFGRAPKFPTPHQITFLLRYARRSKDDWARTMADRTLDAMARGGIQDHVGFGFHRYSTDAKWLVPHFEKMLYDQAMLVMAYVDGFLATGKAAHEQTAREILRYVERDLSAPQGGFRSAEDADSEGVEGKFYAWTLGEVESALGREDAALAARVFQLRPEGNFVEEGHGSPSGANLFHRTADWAKLAQELGRPEPELLGWWEKGRARLLAHRARRVRPALDGKVLCDWNGLMISGFARAAQAFHDPSLAAPATTAAEFVLRHLRTKDGRLLHRFHEGEAAIPAFLDDYAFLVQGLLDLYEATFDARHASTAVELMQAATRHFWDEAAGAFSFTADDAEPLLVREKEFQDGALPSGNSVMMLNLSRLARMTGEGRWQAQADRLARAFANPVTAVPVAHTAFLGALDFALGPTAEVVIVGDADAGGTKELVRGVRSVYAPNKVVLQRTAGAHPLDRLAPFTKDLKASGDGLAYVCRDFACERPTDDPRRLRAQLSGNDPARQSVLSE